MGEGKKQEMIMGCHHGTKLRRIPSISSSCFQAIMKGEKKGKEKKIGVDHVLEKNHI